jgi:uncharacterized protein (DUF433 family)
MVVRDDSLALQMISYALRHPRGRYTAERAAQLSGVPRSTIYDWRRDRVYVPDYTAAQPLSWSYRDLVYLRLLAWLRQLHMPRPIAAERVLGVKVRVQEGEDIRQIRATNETLLLNEEREDRLGGPNLLPFTDLLGLVSTFDLLEPVEELRSSGRDRVWAPDLVNPSVHTYISPWVLAGDPCISQTRIPSAAVFALRSERGLTTEAIANLYPGLTVDAASDAFVLEQRLRGHELPIAS